MVKVDAFGPNGVEIVFGRLTCLELKKDLEKARCLFRDRHLGNNTTMQKEKEIINNFIQLTSLIIEDDMQEVDETP
jgi:hypothetical protein